MPESRVYKVPDGFSCEEAAVFEPPAVGVHVVSGAKVSLGDTVVIRSIGQSGNGKAEEH